MTSHNVQGIGVQVEEADCVLVYLIRLLDGVVLDVFLVSFKPIHKIKSYKLF